MASALAQPPVDRPVMITGASGFIGRRLRAALLQQGVDVISLRRPASPETKEGRSVSADYADQERLNEIIEAERPALIFHVAGATKGVTYADFQRANVMPTENLLQACKTADHSPQRFVFVSSLAAYGPTSLEAPLEESAPRQPMEHYGRSKAEAEEAVEAAGLPFTIVRPGGVYGPGDVDYFEVFKMAAKGWNTFFGNRHRLFSAVYVDDLIDAILTAAQHEHTVNKGYFISAGEPLSWQQFQGAVVEASGRSARELDLPEFLVSWAAWGGELVTKIDGRPRLFNRQKAAMGAQPAWTCRATAAERDFGFAPKVDLKTGIDRAFEWYRAEGWI